MFCEIEYFVICLVVIATIIFSVQSTSEQSSNRINAIDVLILPSTSHILKAVCCVLIILHHWAFRVQSSICQEIFKQIGGGYALSVFFLLSSYGIVKSELKTKTNAISYLKRRMWKIIKPYLILVVFMIVAFRIIGARYPLDELWNYRIPDSFVLLGENKVSIEKYLMYLINGKSFSAHLWFVELTLFSYVFFYISKTIFDINTQRLKLFITYAFLLSVTFWGVYFVENEYFVYVRNFPMLIIGLFAALYEREILKIKWGAIGLYLVINVFLIVHAYFTHELISCYLIYANYAILSIWILNNIMQHYSLKNNSPVILLSSLSYIVYLIHSFFNYIEWWCWGYKSVLFVFSSSILFAYVYRCLQEKRIIPIHLYNI